MILAADDRHWQHGLLDRCVEQVGPILSAPLEKKISVDAVIERQLRHRDARFTCLLCQAPLEVDWMIRSPLPGRPFGLNRQFGPHHFMVHTTLPTLVSTVQTV